MASREPQKAPRKTPVSARTEAARRRALKAHAHARIDAYMQSLGIRDPAEFTDEHGSRHIGDGDVEVIAFVDVVDDLVTFGAGAMLMPLPSDGALLAPLMRTLLDRNLSIVGTPRFGIANGQVVLSLLQPVEAMGDDEFGDRVSELMLIGRHLAKELRKKFGGTVKTRKGIVGRNRARHGRTPARL